MNIHQLVPFIQSSAAEAQVSGVSKLPNTPKPTLVSPRSDHAELSDAASLASQAASLPDVRTEKIEEVKAAIADGSYNVSSADVAQSLVNHMLGKE